MVVLQRSKGPAVVPCKLGNAHGVYNSSGKTLRWLNFGVSTVKGRGDNFDLGDNLVGAKLDPIPQFVSGQLKKESMRSNANAYPGANILYKRIFSPDIFSTTWDHVDHVILPAGSTGSRKMDGFEEIYYVIKGNGKVLFNSDSATVQADDAFYGLSGETIKLSGNGKEDLELLVIGIRTSGSKDQSRTGSGGVKKAMVLQMDFVVPKENADAFEKMYTSVYVPAMLVQSGYIESKILRLFPESIEKEIEGEPTTYNYQIQISFDTEENRRKWVASEQHKIAWPAASKLATSFKWRGYDVVADDNQLLKRQ
jgi:mannose-6-phosphate isomerase-like protein (cupin superfamily)/heme-degrading monooxygenase HmoA